ncbi:DUF6349 family protein [Kitasatospora sp. NPDC036755]|uniref:DUF6349 family protein n=1 Tax=Kitasatospora sp. NPDC036755 TaxID=3154600 RepID=UPI0033EB0B0C
MRNLDDLRRRLAAPFNPNTDHPATAGQLLWHALTTAGHAPTVPDLSGGRTIAVDLPDRSSIQVTENITFTITHAPADHWGWSATHVDPDDDAASQAIYEGTRDRSLATDSAACVQAITAWTAAHTAVGAINRHNAHLALPATIPRNTRRSTWQLGYAAPGFRGNRPATPTNHHTATRLDRWVHHELQRRGACLSCTWEGPIRPRHNDAIEDALDHAHPGWRDLPALPQGATRKSGPQLRAHREAIYPPGWLDNGGPYKVFTTTANDRHEAGRAPGGGYLVKVHQPEKPDTRYEQHTLL